MFLWICLALAQAQSTLSVPFPLPTVQAAVIVAEPGDTIEVDAGANFYRDGGEDVLINKDLTIRGINGQPVLPRLIVLNATVDIENVGLEGVGRIFSDMGLDIGLDVGAVAILSTLTLTDVNLISSYEGSAGVAGLESDLYLDNVGAMDFWLGPPVALFSGRLDVVDSSFIGNFEGAIVTSNADVSVVRTNFNGNYGYVGTDIQVINNERRSLVVDECTFNLSTGDAGGAIAANNANVAITNSTFTDTWAWETGGAILAESDGEPFDFLVDNCTFEGGLSSGGGAIAVSNLLDGQIVDSTFSDNTADAGGAVYFGNGALSIIDSTFERNATFFGEGGAVYLSDLGDGGGPADVVIDNVDFFGLQGATAGLSGGCIFSDHGTTIDLRGGSFHDCAADLNGGAIAFNGVKLTLNGTTLKDSSAITGGALWMGAGNLDLKYSALFGNEAAFGAAVHALDTTISMEQNWFTANTASSTGALDLLDTLGLKLQGNRFCDNTAETSGAVVTLTAKGLGEFVITNNVWMYNRTDLGSALYYSPSDWLLNIGPPVAIHNNDFLANNVSTAVFLSGEVDFTNNIVADQPIGMILDQGINNDLTGGYNLWAMNGVHSQGTGQAFPGAMGVVGQDPMFQGLIPDECNSNLHLQADSPARETGDPTIFDVDGSRSDIGAYGGPAADLYDGDGDGWYDDLDCNDADNKVHPGVPDIPYDGVDNDCDGEDLCDGDGDGFNAEQCGGDDCDDTNQAIHPDARDLPDDGIDQNCDKFEPQTWVSGGGGCGADSTGGVPGVGWLLAFGLVARRRR